MSQNPKLDSPELAALREKRERLEATMKARNIWSPRYSRTIAVLSEDTLDELLRHYDFRSKYLY